MIRGKLKDLLVYRCPFCSYREYEVSDVINHILKKHKDKSHVGCEIKCYNLTKIVSTPRNPDA